VTKIFRWTLTSKDEELSACSKTANERSHDLGVRSGDDNQGSAADLLEFLRDISLAGVDVVISAELVGEILLVVAGGQSDGPVAHLASILKSKVTETTETLDGDGVALDDVHLADTVEDSDTGAEQRRKFSGVDAVWDAHDGLGAQVRVLGVATVAIDSVDDLVVAHLEEAPVAGLAGAVVAAVPWTTDAVTNLPFLLAGPDGDDGADDFVTRHAREGAHGTEVALLQGRVAVADTAGGDLDQDVALTWSFDWDVLDCPWAVRALEDDGLAGFWDLWRRHCVACVWVAFAGELVVRSLTLSMIALICAGTCSD